MTIAVKGAQSERLVLTECNGRAADGAIEAAARWLGAPSPTTRNKHAEARLQSIVARIQAVAAAFPGRTVRVLDRCTREAGRAGHDHKQAIDIAVEGVALERLVAVCRTLPDTACGQSDGEAFVHMESRRHGSGHLFWFDRRTTAAKP